MYIVSVAGQKMYGLNSNFMSDRGASNTQIYQHITLSSNRLSYKSYTVTSELCDDLVMIKNKRGVNRRVVGKELGGIKQRTKIPPGEEGKYTIEELQKFNLKYQTQ